jgi:hypothetical protein
VWTKWRPLDGHLSPILLKKPVPSNNAIFSEALVRSWSLDPHSLEAEISPCHELQIRIDAARRVACSDDSAGSVV